jgi:hypothetical protein
VDGDAGDAPADGRDDRGGLTVRQWRGANRRPTRIADELLHAPLCGSLAQARFLLLHLLNRLQARAIFELHGVRLAAQARDVLGALAQIFLAIHPAFHQVGQVAIGLDSRVCGCGIFLGVGLPAAGRFRRAWGGVALLISYPLARRGLILLLRGRRDLRAHVPRDQQRHQAQYQNHCTGRRAGSFHVYSPEALSCL